MAKKKKQTVNGQTVRTTSAKKKSSNKKKQANRDQKSQKLSGLSGPPLGTYDPALDVELRSSRRGLSDLLADTRRGKRLRRQDVVTALALLQRGRNREAQNIDIAEGRGYEDLGTDTADLLRDYARTMQDFGTAEGRAGEDFDYRGRALDREFGFLGNKQNQDINARGLLNSGAAEAAAGKRAANQAFQFEPIQTNFNRQIEDINQGRGRATEDRDVGLAALATERARLGEDVGLGRERLGQDFTSQQNESLRGFKRDNRTDRINTSRAKREGAIFETDILAKKFFDAAQRDPSLNYGMPKFLTGPKGTKAQQQGGKKRNRRR